MTTSGSEQACVPPAYPWVCDPHPEAELLDARLPEWIGDHLDFLPDGAGELYRTAGLGLAVGVVFPRGSPERLRPVVRAFVYCTALHDFHRSAEPARTARAARRAHDLLLGAATEADDHGILRLVAVAGEELRALMPAEFTVRFAASVQDFLALGAGRETTFRRGGVFPTVEECLAIREYSIGVGFCADLFELFLPRPLPSGVARHPLLARLRQLAARMSALQNDMFTAERARTEPPGVVNTLLAAEHHWGLTPRRSHAYALLLNRRAVEEFALLREELPGFGPEDALVAEYVERIACLPGGWSRWYAMTRGASATPGPDAG
ncbi:terpene synthase family protein [Streptomyces sp. NPDC000594]|uniref:terpene synthase family protein n=1 Tax=Streptomyces sp. NPDC000594 TaxID=3154261 RepID=UPI0033336528